MAATISPITVRPSLGFAWAPTAAPPTFGFAQRAAAAPSVPLLPPFASGQRADAAPIAAPVLAGQAAAPGPPAFAAGQVAAPGPTAFAAGQVAAPGPTAFAAGQVAAPGPTAFAAGQVAAPGPTAFAAGQVAAPGPTSAFAAGQVAAPGPPAFSWGQAAGAGVAAFGRTNGDGSGQSSTGFALAQTAGATSVSGPALPGFALSEAADGQTMATKPRSFKATSIGDSERNRRRREEAGVSLRKERRAGALVKRGRRQQQQPPATTTPSTTTLPPSATIVATETEVELPKAYAALRSGDVKTQFQAATWFRKQLSCEKSAPIAATIKVGAVPFLMAMAAGLSPTVVGNAGKTVPIADETTRLRMQFEAAWAITNVASGTSAETRVVVNHGGVPLFANILHQYLATTTHRLAGPTAATAGPSSGGTTDLVKLREELCVQALWGLANIAGDGAECRNAVLQSGILTVLPSLCKVPSTATQTEIVEQAAYLMSNLCRCHRGQGGIMPIESLAPLLPSLVNLLGWDEAEGEGAVTDACWAFAHLTDTLATSLSPAEETKRLGTVVRCGALPKLLKHMQNECGAIAEAAVQCIGNIVSGGDNDLAQVVIDAGALPQLLLLTEHERPRVAKEAMWSLSNVAAGTHAHIAALLSTNLPADGGTFADVLVRGLVSGRPDVQREAAWVVYNVGVGGSAPQQTAMMQPRIVQALCTVLDAPQPEAVLIALQTLELLLRASKRQTPPGPDGGPSPVAALVEECGGSDKIDYLNAHEQEDIYETAARIIKDHFEDDPDVDPF